MNELVQTITEAIQEKKGSNIVIADLRKIEGTISQYFIICQGNSPSQVEAITESVGDWIMRNGWRWTTVMCWCISSCPTCASFTTLSTSGKMPH